MTKQEAMAAVREEVLDLLEEARENKRDALHDDLKQFWHGKVFAALDVLHAIDNLEAA